VSVTRDGATPYETAAISILAAPWATLMEFSFSDEQLVLRALAGRIFAARANDDSLRGFTGQGDWIDRELWRDLAAAGLIGLPLPVECGGAGLGMLDLCILLEEQGRCLAPAPLLQTVVLAAWPTARFASSGLAADLLAGIVAGDTVLAAALDEMGRADWRRPRAEARRDGGGWIVSGVKENVPFAHLAKAVLVSARTDAGVVLLAVDPNAAGVEMDRQVTVSYQPQCRVRLDGVRVAAERVVAPPESGGEWIGWLEQRAMVATAALQVGICAEALRRTAAYTSERVQFGRPIGSFQSVSMRAADAYMTVEAMRSTMWQAAWRIDAGLPAEEACRIAHWWAAAGGHRVVHTTQHLHGGVGADADYPIHRFFLWSKQVGMTLGGEARQLQRLGSVHARHEPLAEGRDG